MISRQTRKPDSIMPSFRSLTNQHSQPSRGGGRSRIVIYNLRTPDTVELGWTQRGENEPQVGAWKEGLGGREFLAEMNQHGIVGRRAQAMEPHV